MNVKDLIERLNQLSLEKEIEFCGPQHQASWNFDPSLENDWGWFKEVSIEEEAGRYYLQGAENPSQKLSNKLNTIAEQLGVRNK